MGFHPGTLHGYFLQQGFWPNLNFPLKHQIKLVLKLSHFRCIEYLEGKQVKTYAGTKRIWRQCYEEDGKQGVGAPHIGNFKLWALAVGFTAVRECEFGCQCSLTVSRAFSTLSIVLEMLWK